MLRDRRVVIFPGSKAAVLPHFDPLRFENIGHQRVVWDHEIQVHIWAVPLRTEKIELCPSGLHLKLSK